MRALLRSAAILLPLSLLPGQAAAFCLVNDSALRVAFKVDIDGDGRNAPFKRSLNPRAEVCCDWRQRHCNNAAEPDAMLQFSATRPLGVVEWTCYFNARADARVSLRKHAASQGCRWSAAAVGTAGDETGLWERFLQVVADLF